MGSREFTAFDLDEVAAQIARFQKEIEKLSGAVRTTRVVRIVPRDL